jgi:hypothetical protein
MKHSFHNTVTQPWAGSKQKKNRFERFSLFLACELSLSSLGSVVLTGSQSKRLSVFYSHISPHPYNKFHYGSEEGAFDYYLKA